MSRFEPALQPEILRAHQKDEQHIASLQKEVSEVARSALGIRRWMLWRSEIDAISSFLYYCATTLSGLQTLGEEYVHILQVNRSLKSIPSVSRRTLSVALHTFGGTLTSALLNLLKRARGADLNALRTLLGRSQQIHLILFYLLGRYHSPANRVAGIRYVLVRKWLSNPQVARCYKVLGWLSLIEFVVSLTREVRAFTTASEDDDVDEARSPNYSCCMCVDGARRPTVIPCGHVFCWYCIAGWLRAKKECPLCRMQCEPQRAVLLRNIT